jgi:hypothetical protein
VLSIWAATANLGSGAAPEPPSENILGWWQYDTGITESGGLVSAWADQSGNGYNATEAGGSKPALNADGSIGFVGGKKLSATTVPNTAQPITICLRMKSAVDLARFFGGQEGLALYIASGTYRMFAGSDANSTIAHVVDEWVSLVAVFDGASSAVAVTGDSATGFNPGTDGITSNAGISFNDPSFHGGATWDCAEVIVYSAALDASQITQALTYLDSINPA